MKSSNRFSFALIAAIALCASSFSFAKDNNNGTNSNSAAVSGSSSNAGAAAGAISGALSSSNSSVYGSQQSYDANNIDITSGTGNSRALGIAFAAPAYTTVPGAVGCARTNSQAVSLVFGLLSSSESKQTDSRLCIMIQMRDRAHEACQFATAAKWDARIVKEMFPDEQPEPVNTALKNLDPSVCHPANN